ncbi:MAG: transcription initiation factor IIB [Candidatus Bathyarchaeota archaeon]|nr:transcription initiation factor IIB [Candidatus Bathyarchaeota archaeon]
MEKTKEKTRPQLVVANKCPECESSNLVLDYDTGETICGNCGLVIQDVMMDEGPEWRAFTQEEKASRSRVGIPSSYSVHDKGLSTSIDRIDRDAFGRKLPLSTRLQMWRLRKWQIRSRVHSSIDRNLAQAMTELDRLSDKVSAPASIKEKAALIYRKALDLGLVRGRSIAAIAAASLYAACRISGTPRNLREISEASLVTKKDVARCYRLLLRKLDINMPIADPLIYITKISERSGVSGNIQSIAVKIVNEARKKNISAGKDPMGFAAAALYIACKQTGEKKTQKEIADAAGVTEVTVRNRFKNLKKHLKIEIPE